MTHSDHENSPAPGPSASMLPGMVRRRIACKCCGSPSELCGVVDFSRCGADIAAGRKVDPYTGFPVYFYRCAACGFTFSPAFDDWSTEMFGLYIYNDDYPRHDPDYRELRPEVNAAMLIGDFLEMAEGSVLDYGSGMGLLEHKLRNAGFADVTSYDPYSAPTRPDRHFDTILAFEVFEHHPDPRQLFADLVSLMQPGGALLFSTVLVSPAVHIVGLENWWYCVPRNGHISFFTAQALTHLAAQHHLQFRSLNDGLHMIFGERPPAWVAKHLPSTTAAPAIDTGPRFARALEHHRAGRLAEALEGYKDVLAADPRHVPAINNLALLFDSETRESLLRSALEIDAGHPDALLNLAVLLYGSGRLEEAKDFYLRARDVSPDDERITAGLHETDKALAERGGALQVQ